MEGPHQYFSFLVFSTTLRNQTGANAVFVSSLNDFPLIFSQSKWRVKEQLQLIIVKHTHSLT